MSWRARTDEDRKAAALYSAIQGHPTHQQSHDFARRTAVFFHRAGHPREDLELAFIAVPPTFYGNKINGKKTRVTLGVNEPQGVAFYPNIEMMHDGTDFVRDQFFFLILLEPA